MQQCLVLLLNTKNKLICAFSHLKTVIVILCPAFGFMRECFALFVTSCFLPWKSPSKVVCSFKGISFIL